MQLEDFINDITPLPEKVLLEVKNKFKKKSYLKGTQIILSSFIRTTES